MRFCISIIVLLLGAAFVSSAQAGSLTGKTIRFCGDGSGWPPYTYIDPKEPGIVKGYDVDVLTEILEPHGIKAEFAMPSWKQCLERTDAGKAYQVALSSSYSDARAERFLYTRKYYTSVQSFFYSKRRFSEKPNIKSASDLFLYGQVCGRYAYNYEGTGVIKNDQVNMAAKSYTALVLRTMNDDCAFFLGRPSIILGFKLIGKELFDSRQIGFAAIPKAKKDDFYMLISRNVSYSEELKGIIDDGILRMEKSGRLKEILDRYYMKMQS
ncbi:transporter substrate-binding domain-containing protein [Terasakiella sp. A23]|uniref:substrate-binding periplasmic protein n=1 Tax=Terasakiella sp. FCG-A23 TaxID=3080561 RepID=UPI002954D694|nr:transporter substrate-binding domain-containing protein [Terasakiella sp. A23]MDV7340153.1 transporter substrate-binding domain-containing protein [Terasakiella sp. A23]